MEGPSLAIAEEQLQPFCGKKILSVAGNTSLEKEKFVGEEIKNIFSWGKHLIFQFESYGLRVHFLMFGSYAATVEGMSVTGDYKKTQVPRLSLVFENGHIDIYSCSIKIIEESDIHSTYDFSRNIMSTKWNSDTALEKILVTPNEQICDVLLDQEIFAGVGNIIKNEVLWLIKIHPQTLVSSLSKDALKLAIDETKKYSMNFYTWKKEYTLKAHFQIYRKKVCARCETEIIRAKTGERERWTYYCPNCQKI